MRDFWAWYRHARSWGKPVRASLVYAHAKTRQPLFASNKATPAALDTPRGLTGGAISDDQSV